jgi:hypothetical protein
MNLTPSEAIVVENSPLGIEAANKAGIPYIITLNNTPLEISEVIPKSKEAQAFKLFSEGKSPIEVAITLDLEAGRVRAIYYDYWELKGMYKVVQIYDLGLIRLHKMVKDLGMNEHDIMNVLHIAKHNELQNLQWKVEYLRYEVNTLESDKMKATNDILKLNRTIDQMEANMPKRGEMAHMNQQWTSYDNTDNLYPIPYSEPNISSYSIGLYYRDYRPWQ